MGYRSSKLGNLSCNMAKGFWDLVWNPLKSATRGLRICHSQPTAKMQTLNLCPSHWQKEKLFPKVKKELSRGLARLLSQRLPDGWMCWKTSFAHQNIVEVGKRRSTGSSLTFPSHSPCRIWHNPWSCRARNTPRAYRNSSSTRLQSPKHHNNLGRDE